MIMFLDEDRAYLYWVTHHRTGFVLDCSRKPNKRRLVIHRSTCPEIRAATSKRTHWTTGRRMKACALDEKSLEAWAAEQAGVEPERCATCFVDPESLPNSEPLHLSHLDREVLSFVLDVAVMHLDGQDDGYLLTVGKTAKCLAKTPGQLNASLQRLAQNGLLTMVGTARPSDPLPVACQLFPTVAALKSLPAFENLPDNEIESQLATLAGPDLGHSRTKSE